MGTGGENGGTNLGGCTCKLNLDIGHFSWDIGKLPLSNWDIGIFTPKIGILGYCSKGPVIIWVL